MRTSAEHPLMVATRDMPAEACALLRELAETRGWRMRCESRPLPRVHSGEVVVAMASLWLATPRVPRTRGVLLLTADAPPAPAVPGGAGRADVVMSWPCDAADLLDRLGTLMAPSPLQLDAVTRTATHGGRVVQLTPRECRILEVLMAHAGEAVTREALEACLHVWGQEFQSNTLDVHIHRLRCKLPAAGIRAVRGYGYVLLARRGASLPSD